ncbi:MAG: hypothetical protein H7X76_09765 [Prolixibacteraceae bacterium]|nr:hypothetical protein [Burkholderiales bacterium]
MKPQAALLIVLGLLIGPGYYVFCEHISGRPGQNYALTERASRWPMPDGSILRLRGGMAYKPLPVELSPESNDYRLRFSFNVSQHGSVAADATNEYQVSLLQGDSGGIHRSIQVRGRGKITVTPDPLEIFFPGSYVLVLEEVGTPTLTVSGVSVRIDTDVQKPTKGIVWSGLVLLVFGIGILVRDAIMPARKRH